MTDLAFDSSTTGLTNLLLYSLQPPTRLLVDFVGSRIEPPRLLRTG